MATPVAAADLEEERQESSFVNDTNEPRANGGSNDGDETEKPRKRKINIPFLNRSGTRKPPSHPWLQQQMPACRPMYTGKHCFILFTIVGLLFLILGAVFLAVNLPLHEVVVPYTTCTATYPNDTENNCSLAFTFPTCDEYIQNLSNMSNFERFVTNPCPCFCNIEFEVPEPLTSQVNVYYQLNNFYQNHRRYVNSWDVGSLRGNGITDSHSDCNPLNRDENMTSYWPCGVIANSFFNDTFWIRQGNNNTLLDISQKDISWPTDRDIRFRNPPSSQNPINNSDIVTNGTVLPPNWPKLIDHGVRNESFIVWFRVAAFPDFRKLFGRLNGDLPAGNYSLTVLYNFPVTPFGGGKSLVITEVSFLGTRNLFIGILYLVTGGLSLVSGVVLLVVHYTCSKWNRKDELFLDREY